MVPFLVGILVWGFPGPGVVTEVTKPSYAGKIDNGVTHGEGIFKTEPLRSTASFMLKEQQYAAHN